MVYSGLQNVAIPATLDGAYVRLSDGAVSGVFPANWSTEPWLNPFFGGVDVANSPLLLPIITGTSQVVNLAPGTVIDSTGDYVAGESGSSTPLYPASNHFQIGTPGLIGFEFISSMKGRTCMVSQNDRKQRGSRTIVDWAYDNTPGTSIQAGHST